MVRRPTAPIASVYPTFNAVGGAFCPICCRVFQGKIVKPIPNGFTADAPTHFAAGFP